MLSNKDGTRFFSSLLVTGNGRVQFYQADGMADISGLPPSEVQACIDQNFAKFKAWSAETFAAAARRDGFTDQHISNAGMAPFADLKRKELLLTDEEVQARRLAKQSALNKATAGPPLDAFGRLDMEKYLAGMERSKNFIKVNSAPKAKPSIVSRLLRRFLVKEKPRASSTIPDWSPHRRMVKIERVDLSSVPQHIRDLWAGKDDSRPDGGVDA